MFGVIFLAVTYYFLTFFKGINVNLGKRRFDLNEQRLIFAKLLAQVTSRLSFINCVSQQSKLVLSRDL